MNEGNPAEADPHGWRREGRDLLQAVAGGAIVGMPLLYTMEMWQHGMTMSEWHLLGLLGAILALNFVFCLLSGFREENSLLVAAMESVTAVGIAIVFSTAILCLIGEIEFTIGAAEIIGKILLEAAPVSVGVSFAQAQMQGRSRTGDDEEKKRDRPESRDAQRPATAEGDGDPVTKRTDQEWATEETNSPGDRQLKADLREFAAAMAGSTVFALNVAPTEEITLIAARLSPMQLLLMLGFSALLCYIILFAAEFREHRVHEESIFQHPVAETVLTCAVSLTVSAVLLMLLGDRSILTHPALTVAAVVTLGLPATVGGAAGRLIA